MTFDKFAAVVGTRFAAMSKTPLFRTTVEKDKLWETYLNSFPAGANPVFKTRTEHDCTCCRHFIKTLGGVVTIVDGKIQTLWDFDTKDPKYQPVVDALDKLVRQHPIENVFLHPEGFVGTEKTRSLLAGDVVAWKHLFVNLPRECVARGTDIGTRLGDARSTYDVMLRGLSEIPVSVVDTVLDLIAQNSLYRGEEHSGALQAFRKLQVAFAAAPDKTLFCWSQIKESAAIARLRNTAIGTLLTDLATDVDLEVAVKSFERKVAPTNYKRPTALVTPAMIKKAQAQIEELGWLSALERRYATIEDITINNVLFADRTAKQKMNVFDDLASGAVVDTTKLGKIEDIPIDTFLTKVLPTATSLDVLFENKHAGNLVSLIAPVDPTAKGMFKWPNNFSWSYAGELADSIKERVKRAGGSVTGDFRASLSWSNYDDLDFHLVEPKGDHIYFSSKRSKAGGILDVDMNAGSGQTRTPVENITYANQRTMLDGDYHLYVNQFSSREAKDIGFEAELEFLGKVYSFGYQKKMKTGENVTVAKFNVKNGVLIILDGLTHQAASKALWNVPTQTFHKVSVVMMSPNYWDDKTIGNKHFFFMLDECRNEDKARGFFNEFLSEELSAHRKVLEVVGAKMRTEESNKQLSGLGFSSTQRNSVRIRVKGTFTRVVNVTF